MLLKTIISFVLILWLNLMQYSSFKISTPEKNNQGNWNISYTNPCPDPNNTNKKILEKFLTSENWSSEREKTGATGISTNQIKLLQASDEFSICNQLNDEYEGTISKKRNSGEPRYNLTYYKAGDFYFVVISLRQPDDPSQVVAGLSFLDIYKSAPQANKEILAPNLEYLAGYSF